MQWLKHLASIVPR